MSLLETIESAAADDEQSWPKQKSHSWVYSSDKQLNDHSNEYNTQLQLVIFLVDSSSKFFILGLLGIHGYTTTYRRSAAAFNLRFDYGFPMIHTFCSFRFISLFTCFLFRWTKANQANHIEFSFQVESVWNGARLMAKKALGKYNIASYNLALVCKCVCILYISLIDTD